MVENSMVATKDGMSEIDKERGKVPIRPKK